MLSDSELLYTLPVAVLVTQNGVICRTNAAGEALLEADAPGALQGRLLSDFVHTLDKLRSSDRLQQASAPEHTGQPNKPAEFRVRTAKGHLRMVLVSTVGITLDGAPALLICGMDMTHQNEIQEQLRESEHRFRRVFESMQDVYYRTNAQGVVQHVGELGAARQLDQRGQRRAVAAAVGWARACAACWVTSPRRSRAARLNRITRRAATAMPSRPPSWRTARSPTFRGRWCARMAP